MTRLPPAPSSPPAPPPPQGWKWHSPSCYWVGEDLLGYDEAKKSCEGQGATLVTITNRLQSDINTLTTIHRSIEHIFSYLKYDALNKKK